MPKANSLRVSLLLFAALAGPALKSHATEPAVTSDETASAKSPSTSYSRLGVRYVEAYAYFTKGNHERLTTNTYLIEYNQPLTEHVDLGLHYGYSHYQDYRWAYANFGGASVTYHRTFGKLKPFVGTSLVGAQQWTDDGDAHWRMTAGAEYNPVTKLVLCTYVRMGDFFAAGDDLGFHAGAFATYWLFPHVGLYTHGTLFEQGFFGYTTGIVARYQF